jgi:hypothetical protein
MPVIGRVPVSNPKSPGELAGYAAALITVPAWCRGDVRRRLRLFFKVRRPVSGCENSAVTTFASIVLGLPAQRLRFC